MFTVKIVECYPCTINNVPQKVTKTRVRQCQFVEIDEFEKEWIVTLENGDIAYSVPKNHDQDEDWKENGFIRDIFVENQAGKTTHSVRSFPIMAVMSASGQDAIPK